MISACFSLLARSSKCYVYVEGGIGSWEMQIDRIKIFMKFIHTNRLRTTDIWILICTQICLRSALEFWSYVNVRRDFCSVEFIISKVLDCNFGNKFLMFKQTIPISRNILLWEKFSRMENQKFSNENAESFSMRFSRFFQNILGNLKLD